MTIALWFCPQPGSSNYELLRQLISSLQTLFPTSVIFEPHITITTHLICEKPDDVNKILTSCVAAIRSIEYQLRDPRGSPLVSFDSCSIGKPFFKKVTLNCKDNRYLLGLERIMSEMYSSKSKDELSKFKPHASLLYSDVNPVSQAYIHMIEQRIEDALDLRLLQKEETRETNPDVQVEWKFDRQSSVGWNLPGTFKVVKCEGPIHEWEVLGRADV